MKQVLLHAAALDNQNVRREAGETLGVGNGEGQISAERIAALPEGTAFEVKPEAKSATGKAAD